MRRSRFALLGAASLICMMAATALREPNLLDNAAFIADTSGWDIKTNMNWKPYESYFWRTSSDVLFLRLSDGALCDHDIATGLDTELSEVSDWWENDGTYKKQVLFSPDGKRVVWEADYQDREFHSFNAANIDGSQRSRIPRMAMDSRLAWLPDSERLLEIVTQDRGGDSGKDGSIHCHLFIHRANSSQPVTELHANTRYSFGVGELLCTTRGLLLEVSEIGQDNDGIAPAAYAIHSLALDGSSPASKWIVRVPAGLEKTSMCVSPAGDRIGWISASDEIPPLQRMMHGLFPRRPVKTERCGRIYVTDIHGENKRCLGATWEPDTPETEELYNNRLAPQEIKWLPDGKRISFIYLNKLYTLPLD